MSAVEGLLDRAIDGHGAVVGVVGPPGIGKSRPAKPGPQLGIGVSWGRCGRFVPLAATALPKIFANIVNQLAE